MKKFDKHIIITGSARSGTSWLCESISKTFRYRLLFEPDHPIQVPKAKVLADVILNEREDYPIVNNYLTKVFKNKVDSDWIGQNSNRKFKMHLWPIVPKKYVIKFIRTNLGITYIQEHFKIPIIFLVRNPYDVIASQNRVKFPWLYDLSKFQQQNVLVHLVKQISGIDICKAKLNTIEILTIRWCIENVIPIKYQDLKKEFIRVVKYEDLKGNFDLFKSLCDEFAIELAPTIEQQYLKPSSKTHPKSEILRKGKKEKLISDVEYEQIKRILQRFNVDFYDI